ncbi:MAG: signal peptide peptidase SppA [Rhodothermales bacterium]
MKFFSTLVASTLGALLAFGIAFFVFVLFIVALASMSETTPTVQQNSVLVLDLAGTIPERGSADPISRAITGELSYGTADVLRALDMAAVDDRIRGVWIQASSSSTSWAALEEIRKALEDFRASGKPIIASSNGTPISENEYFLMSAADSVFGLPDAPFEFNGFYLNAEFYKGALDKLNVEPQIVRAGRFKSAVEPYLRKDLSPENEEQLSLLLETRFDGFVEAVADRRNLDVGRVRSLLNGTQVFVTNEALAAGLLDGLAYEDEMVARLKSVTGIDEAAELRTVAMSDYAMLSPSAAGIRRNSANEIAVLYAEGTIVNGQSEQGISVGPESIRRQVDRILDRESVKAVVLRINSPGGSVTASDEMLRDLRRLAEEKPIIASMGSVAASGGYWIAMAADTIVADPATVTGSIGVFSLFFNVGGLFSDKLGINFDVVRTGPTADMMSGVRSLSPDERAAWQRRVDDTYDRFISLVAQNRGMTPEQVDELASGRVWSGKDALERQLVDELGGLDDAIAIAASTVGLEEGDYVVRAYPGQMTFLERLSSRMEAGVNIRMPTPKRLTQLEQVALERTRQIEELLRDTASIQARLPVTIRIN